jgi:hypothetical protein
MISDSLPADPEPQTPEFWTPNNIQDIAFQKCCAGPGMESRANQSSSVAVPPSHNNKFHLRLDSHIAPSSSTSESPESSQSDAPLNLISEIEPPSNTGNGVDGKMIEHS